MSVTVLTLLTYSCLIGKYIQLKLVHSSYHIVNVVKWNGLSNLMLGRNNIHHIILCFSQCCLIVTLQSVHTSLLNLYNQQPFEVDLTKIENGDNLPSKHVVTNYTHEGSRTSVGLSNLASVVNNRLGTVTLTDFSKLPQL